MLLTVSIDTEVSMLHHNLRKYKREYGPFVHVSSAQLVTSRCGLNVTGTGITWIG